MEVQRREEVLKKEQKKRDQLASKIKAMEGKLLAGSVEDRTDEAKKALEQKNKEVIEQRVSFRFTPAFVFVFMNVAYSFVLYRFEREKS